jgi:hypothetical protein
MIRFFAKRILLGLLITCVCAVQKTKAQAPSNLFSNVTIASPNAASLGKYGDYPVSNNTGVPQISIPLYSVKEGPLSVPVSLSYHASGLKVMEPASAVGAGWSLNAGGVITRSVAGAPDDRGHLTNTTHGHFSNYGYNNYLFRPDASGSGCSLNPNGNTVSADDAAFLRGDKDGEPDLFFFNFGGYSGKFYFRDDRTPVVVPEEDFKIEPIVVNVGDNITGFIITTTDGTKYYFGKNQNADGNIDAIERTAPYTVDNGLTSGDVNSSWYLNKIKTADDRFFIDLIYQAEKYSYYTISMFPVADGDLLNKHVTLVKNYMDGVRLSRINFSNGSVELLPGAVRTDLGEYQTKTITDLVNTESKTLETIKISDNQNICKSYTLYYSYFTDDISPLPFGLSGGLAVNTDTRRLKLDSILEKSCNSIKLIPPYKFNYNIPSGSFAPRRLTFAQDHWGFYNGKTSNTSLIPTYTVNDFDLYPGADRESSWPEMSYGSLNKITYPTGGSTDFLFEANEIWANYVYYNDVQAASANIGPYIGVTQPQTINLTTTANRYRIVLDYKTSASGNSIGSASIAGITVNKANPHNEIVIIPGAGPHSYVLSQLDMTSATNDWATVRIYEIVSTTFLNNKAVGGLRIKTVTTKNGIAGNDITTNYNYRSGGQSNGFLYSRPTYVRVLRNDIKKQVGFAAASNCSPNGCFNCDITPSYKKSPSSLRPMETSQGNHIGYNNVEVSQTGNGRSVYKYYGSNIWDQNLNDVCIRNVNTTSCALTIPNSPDAPLPFEFIRGELKYEAVYNQAGTLQKDMFYYPVFENNPVTTPAYIVKNEGTTLYSLVTARKTKMTVVSNYYPAAGGTSTTTDSVFYESPYHHQPTRTVSINSFGEKIESKTKYAFDFRVAACDAISDCYAAYNTAYTNALNTFNTQINTCTNSGSCNCKFPVYQQYRYDWSVARINYITCRGTNFNNTTNAFKTAHDAAKGTADANLKPVLELQDKFINVPIEVTEWKAGKLAKASFNKYDYVTNPAGNVYPSKLQYVNLQSLSAAFTPAVVSGTGLTKDSRYLDESVIKFDNGNPVEVTGKDGIITSYIWGYNQQYPVAKIVGKTIADALVQSGIIVSVVNNPATTDAAMRTELNKLRTMTGCFVTTYTYKLITGISSETDPNGKTIYYEYDAMNRLSIVKDQDGNTIRKICYTFNGQVENCTNAAPPPPPPPPGSITIQSNNFVAASGFTAVYTNTSTSQQYSFTIPATAGLQNIGSLLPGTYNLTISKPGNTFVWIFGSGCNGSSVSGTSATFFNISVSATNCNTILVDGV